MDVKPAMRELPAATLPGIPMLLLGLLAGALNLYTFVPVAAAELPKSERVGLIIALVLILFGILIFFGGLFKVDPNKGVVLQLFGRYIGTSRETGLRWTNPFYSKQAISLRVRNFQTEHIKVNDLDGNPIEIAAVIVWQVVDTAEASFEVDEYVNYVHVQSEAAVRNMATNYPYDAHEEGQMSLRGNIHEIAEHLQKEVQERLNVAGVRIIEAKISHLAYAQEIAAAMLQRQQASAVVAARQKIVEGAVGMVEMALAELSQKSIVDLDASQKASMVSNLLVVLCSERNTTPVVNAGTMHH
ncbi:MAG: SPFH domain-containing protein [Bryobacterales bacterium]|jgi:regulator of protease activity HflC (stomatin/prohibitin superfamily)|nr:SPFH domain-containing protein [Bryobacterales bacterium]